MQENTNPHGASFSRRQFIRNSTLAAAAATAVVNFPSIVVGQGKQTINAVIIGMGGRGSGAGENFREAAKEVGVEAKIVAVADIFPEKAKGGKDTFGLPEDKCFSGFDGYQKALEVPGVNYAILATPPGFRAPHFRAAIAAGKNVFMEKPVAVDGPGLKIMYAAHQEALKKNLKVAAGTQRRHRPSYIQTIKQLHDGKIGDITALRTYWVNGGPIWHRGDVGSTDLERQIRNWYHYVWLCGDHICEQHVHNLDIANWIMKGEHPVRAWGMGARQQLEGKSGEIWDNFAVEYTYANGTHLHSYCGQVKRSWASVSEAAAGTIGTVELNDGRNIIKTKDGKVWRPEKVEKDNGYVNEHVDLIRAIIEDKPLNEAKQVTDSTLTAIMGREAAYSGGEVTAEDILNSTFAYGPSLLYQDPSKMTWEAFRTLQPPMPSQHNILVNPPVVPVVKG